MINNHQDTLPVVANTSKMISTLNSTSTAGWRKQNPTNTFVNRIAWWTELIEYCHEHGYMTEYRYNAKKAIANRLIHAWNKNKK